MVEHTLYGFPFSCSLAVRMILETQQIPYQMAWVQRGERRLIEGDDFAKVNPKRKVATLVLPGGEVLTEMVAILHHLDERHQRSDQARRAHLQWLSFLATELHKQVLAPAFDPGTSKCIQEDARDRLLPAVLDVVQRALSDKKTLLGGEAFSPADAYLCWALIVLFKRWPTLDRPVLGAWLTTALGANPVRRAVQMERAALKSRS